MKISMPEKTPRLKQQPVYIHRPSDVFTELRSSLLYPRAPYRNRKHFWVAGLTRLNQVTHMDFLGTGSRNYSMVDAAEVFRTQILNKAEKVILVCNCPAGSKLYPSKKEIAKAMDLFRYGNALKIPMVDYVIISDRTYYSFIEEKNLPGYKAQQ